MPITQINTSHILDRTIQEQDIDVTSPGHSVITSITPGAGIIITSTGTDIGTGEVQISIDPLLSGSDKNYEFFQGIPATLWTINHNLDKFPAVMVFDSTNDNVQIFGDVKHINKNILTVEFSVPFGGTIILN